MAKVKQKPDRLPLPLSFVEGDSFLLCLTEAQVRKIRDRFPRDEETGALAAPELYLDALTEAAVVDDSGALLFAEGDVAQLYDPWHRELQKAVMEVYTPSEKKGSAGATTLPAPSPSTPAPTQ